MKPNHARPAARDGHAQEGGRELIEILDDPGVGQQPAGEVHARAAARVTMSPQVARSRRRRRGGARDAWRAGVGHQRATAVGAGLLEQGAGGGQVADDGGAEPAAEPGGQRQLVAGLDLERVGQRARIARSRRVSAQELVGRRELGPDARRLAARRLGRALGCTARRAGDVAGLVGLGQRRAALFDRLGELGGARSRGVTLRRQGGELALERLGALRVELVELRLERVDALAAGLVGRVLLGLGARRPSSWRPRRSMRSAIASAVSRVRSRRSSMRSAAERAANTRPRKRLALLGAPRQGVLGLLAAAGDLGQLALSLLARGPRGGGGALGARQLLAAGAHGVARELPARLDASGARGARAARRPRPGA